MLLYKLLLSTRAQHGNTDVNVYSVLTKYVYCIYIYTFKPNYHSSSKLTWVRFKVTKKFISFAVR